MPDTGNANKKNNTPDVVNRDQTVKLPEQPKPTGNTAAKQPEEAPAASRMSFTGKMLGQRYLLGKELGFGGMAIVYQAHDTTLEREVAVKVMQPQLTRDVSFEKRFEREAKSAASLVSPHIVSIYDWGNKNGICYIVMELLNGVDVKTLITDNGPFDCRSTARIAAQMCEALSEAHSKGIIHRDIKPQNIMVLNDGNVKLMDFGIARPSNSDLTTTSVVLGTAHYISPEQAQVGDIGPAADLYSLGVVMYECVTGELPFDGDNATAVALKQITEAPVPPSQLNPLVDPTMEQIILKCMAKKAENRFESADELGHVLENYMRGNKVNIPMPADPTFNQAETAYMPPAQPQYDPGATRAMNGGYQNAQQNWNGQAGPYATGQIMVDPNGPGMPGGPQQYEDEEEESWWTTKKKALVGVAIVLLLALTAFGIASALSGGGNDNNNNANNNNIANTNNNNNANNNNNNNNENLNNENLNNNNVNEPKMLTVPGLVGKTRAQAMTDASAAGFKNVKVEEAFSDEVETGIVMAQDPAEGIQLSEKNAAITLTVSKGPEVATVPSVVGLTLEEARNALSAQGFTAGNIEEVVSDQAAGTVIRQAITGDAKPGTTIDLTVSTGAKKVSIPGVVGQTLSSAYAALAGFQVEVEGSQDPDAIVTNQTTGQLEEGGTVKLTTKEPKKEEPQPVENTTNNNNNSSGNKTNDNNNNDSGNANGGNTDDNGNAGNNENEDNNGE